MRFTSLFVLLTGSIYLHSFALASQDKSPSVQFVKFQNESDLKSFLRSDPSARRVHKSLMWVELTTLSPVIFSQQDQKKLGIIEQEHDEIVYRIPRYQRSIQTLNSTPNTKLWGISKINAPIAWSASRGTRDVIVAVVDTGIDFNHPALKENMWRNVAEDKGLAGVDDDGNGFVDDVFGADFISGHPTPMDDEGHGSHVAGTVAGYLPAESFRSLIHI